MVFLFLLLISNGAFAQSRQQIFQDFRTNAPMYIALANVGLIAAKVDPDITNMLDNVVPKIADENIDGAANDVLYLLRRKTGLSYIDPKIKTYLTSKIRSSVDAIANQDYALLVSTVTEFALATDEFIKHRTIPN